MDYIRGIGSILMADTNVMAPLDVADARARLAAAPAMLTAMCAGWPDALWAATEGAGTWTPHQVLCHLLSCEDDNWIPRLRQIVEGEGHRPFAPFPREEGFRRYGGEPSSRLLELFAEKRAESLRTLDEWGLDAAALGLPGTHPEFGPITLEQQLATWVAHDYAHTVQLARIAEKYYGQWIGPWRAYLSVLRDDPISQTNRR
jgi:hypothetical protein